MALDEPKDTDNIYDIDGFQYVVDKEFMEKIEPVKIDFLTIGFKLTSSLELGEGNKSCGASGSCSC